MNGVRYITPASWELHGQLQRYSDANPSLPARFSRAVTSALQQALTFPGSGAKVHRQLRRLLCRSFPYSVIYLPVDGEIVVFAIAHQARRPGYWVDRVREPRVVTYA